MALQLLKDKNAHNRDKNIVFYEAGHKYLVNGKSGYRSVTTIVKNAFEKFNADKIIDNMMNSENWEKNKYFGKTKDEIKTIWKNNGQEAAKMGTAMHAMFEYYYNNIKPEIIKSYEGTKEHSYFMNFIKSYSRITEKITHFDQI